MSVNGDRLTFLPDELGTVRTSETRGLTEVSCAAAFARDAAAAMQADETSVPDVLDVRRRTAEQLAKGDTAHWRGLMAVCLLADTWQEPVRVRTVSFGRDTSPFSRAVLAASGRDRLTLLVLENSGESCVLGLADEQLGLVPAADPEDVTRFLPDGILWADRSRGALLDPCELLNQRDRLLLASRLRLIAGEGPAAAFAEDLLRQDQRSEAEIIMGGAWLTQMKAVLGLAHEPGFSAYLTSEQEACLPVRGDNPLLAALHIEEPAGFSAQEQRLWRWRGVPFARTSSITGLESARDPREAEVLRELAEMEGLMEQNSARYPGVLAEAIGRWLQSHPGVCAASSGMLGEEQRRLAGMNGRSGSELTLTWPWQNDSPAVRLLLNEALGERMALGAAHPFPDRLTLMAGGDLNDALLNRMCSVTLEDTAWTSLLPLSEGLAACVAMGHGLDADSISLTDAGEGSVQVTLRLHMAGNVCLERIYPPEEQLRLTGEEIPGVSMWPSVPVSGGRWKAYFVSVRGDVSIGVLRGGTWTHALETGDLTRVRTMKTEDFPGCITLHRGSLCLGAVMYHAEPFVPAHMGAALAAIDPGASGVSMAMKLGGQLQPVSMPSLWRVLLRGGVTDLPGETLPVWPVDGRLPAAVTLIGDAADPQPFVDGRAVQSEALADAGTRDQAVYDVVWRVDALGRRARRLLLREVMLITSFHAVMCGAESIRWRAALPSSVAEGGRRQLLEEIRSLAEEMAIETGLALSGPTEGLAGALAAGMYLRDSGLMRGAFLLLDIGAGNVSADVWLRGVEHPVLSVRLPNGVSAMLAAGLMERPNSAAEDFAELDPELARDLHGALNRASGSVKGWEHLRLMMDDLLGPRLPELMGYMSHRSLTGRMTTTHALLILGFAQVMTLMGLSLEKVYRNPMMNDFLPQDLALCLCGRGSMVMTGLDEAVRYQLMRFVRMPMSPEHPVHSIRMTGSGVPGMEAVLGLTQMTVLPPPRDAGPGMPVMPNDVLVRYFLMQFNLCFPQASALLFPGMFGPGGQLTPAAEAAVNAVLAGVQGSEEQAFAAAIAQVRAHFVRSDE